MKTTKVIKLGKQAINEAIENLKLDFKNEEYSLDNILKIDEYLYHFILSDESTFTNDKHEDYFNPELRIFTNIKALCFYKGSEIIKEFMEEHKEDLTSEELEDIEIELSEYIVKFFIKGKEEVETLIGKKWKELSEEQQNKLMNTATVDPSLYDKNTGECTIDFEGTKYSIAGEVIETEEERVLQAYEDGIIYDSTEGIR